MPPHPDPHSLLAIAYREAVTGLAEGGVPVGAALFDAPGTLISSGRNRRVQHDDPSIHGETDAFRRAGRQTTYRDKILVSTLAPCWYCSGLVRQFNIGTVIVGESVNFQGGTAWLEKHGTRIIDLHDQPCIDLLRTFIKNHPEIWNEDIGKLPPNTP